MLYGFRKLMLLDIGGFMFLMYYSLPLFVLGIQPSKTVSFAREHIGALLRCCFFSLCCPVCLICLWVFFLYRPAGWNGRLMSGAAGVNGASAVGAVAVESAFGNGAAIPKGEGQPPFSFFKCVFSVTELLHLCSKIHPEQKYLVFDSRVISHLSPLWDDP